MWVVSCNTWCFDQSQVTVLTDLISLMWNATEKNKRRKKKLLLPRCVIGPFEIKIYLSEIAIEMQNTISFVGDLTQCQMTVIWNDGTVSQITAKDSKDFCFNPDFPFFFLSDLHVLKL